MQWSTNDLLKLTECNRTVSNSVTAFCCNFENLTYLPEYIDLLTNLSRLDCSTNQLTSLPEAIGLLTNLTELRCNHNRLTSLPESIGNLTNLTKLYCFVNNLTSLPDSIGKLTNLTELRISCNNLTHLPDSIGLLRNLTKLIGFGNNLTTLPTTIGMLINLTHLDVANNNLTILPAELGNCRRLQIWYYDNNPIEFIPINIQRLLDRIGNHQYIYSDGQNVHNHEIQQSISKSVYNLLNDTMVLQLSVKNSTIDNILKSSLADKTKAALIEYSEDTSVHTVLNISFKELLDYVWQRIENHKDKENILRILEEEMSDAECKCFTGRISRLINCLNGFYDDIRIEIGEKEQIGNIIVLIRDKLVSEGKYTVTAHKEQVIAALKERNYSDSEIDIWTYYIE